MSELLEITRNHNLHILGLLHFTGSLGSSTSAPSTTLEFLYILSKLNIFVKIYFTDIYVGKICSRIYRE